MYLKPLFIITTVYFIASYYSFFLNILIHCQSTAKIGSSNSTGASIAFIFYFIAFASCFIAVAFCSIAITFYFIVVVFCSIAVMSYFTAAAFYKESGVGTRFYNRADSSCSNL